MKNLAKLVIAAGVAACIYVTARGGVAGIISDKYGDNINSAVDDVKRNVVYGISDILYGDEQIESDPDIPADVPGSVPSVIPESIHKDDMIRRLHDPSLYSDFDTIKNADSVYLMFDNADVPVRFKIGDKYDEFIYRIQKYVSGCRSGDLFNTGLEMRYWDSDGNWFIDVGKDEDGNLTDLNMCEIRQGEDIDNGPAIRGFNTGMDIECAFSVFGRPDFLVIQSGDIYFGWNCSEFGYYMYLVCCSYDDGNSAYADESVSLEPYQFYISDNYVADVFNQYPYIYEDYKVWDLYTGEEITQ